MNPWKLILLLGIAISIGYPLGRFAIAQFGVERIGPAVGPSCEISRSASGKKQPTCKVDLKKLKHSDKGGALRRLCF